jgi:hypothetical protein
MLQPLPSIWQSLSFNSPWPTTPGMSSKRIVSPAPSSSAGLPTATCPWSSWRPAARPTTGRAGSSLGIEVKLLPAQYVRAYVKRNKTDAADAAALLEAVRASDIRPVRVKSVEQQALQGLHRIRSLWMGTRTSRINALRGFCREFGIAIPVGARTGMEAIGRVLADPQTAVPDLIRGTASLLMEEIRLLEARIAQLERELTDMARSEPGLQDAAVGTRHRAAHGHRHGGGHLWWM